MIGTSKAWFCGMDGTAYELTGQGGSWFPQYGKNFTYTGDYVIVPENDTDWKVKFLTSGTFTATDALLIDVFAVGGGGGAGAGLFMSAGTGGGGGYTTTQKSVYLEQDKEYEIVIGNGGKGYPGSNVYKGTDGGTTSGFNITANGGGGGYSQTTREGYGGSGGSGGGAGIQGAYNESFNVNGGSDGSDGYGSKGDSSAEYIGSVGKGQGTTTREFGETSGELYAGGGGGGIDSYTAGYKNDGSGGGGSGSAYNENNNCGFDGTANTGGGGGGGDNVSDHTHYPSAGGGGGYTKTEKSIQLEQNKEYQILIGDGGVPRFHYYNESLHGGYGGSGILIIRNHRE